jgi:serine/threonine protein kinase
LFNGKNEIDMLRMILKMFQGSEELPNDLSQTFYQNNIFSSVRLPVPNEEDWDFSNSLDHRLDGMSNATVSFARECLRLDPAQRPSASELLNHDYFNNFRETFEQELENKINADKQYIPRSNSVEFNPFSYDSKPETPPRNEHQDVLMDSSSSEKSA